MANWKQGRSASRASAVALLYSADIVEGDAVGLIEEGRYPSDDFELSEYAEDLVRGVQARRTEIDGCLERTSENWTLDRMPYLDRAILRLAVYEMLFVDDVPVSVAIDEAVELAKVYGGEDESSRFVNGVLGRIARMIDGEQTNAVSDEPDVCDSRADAVDGDAPDAGEEAPDGQ